MSFVLFFYFFFSEKSEGEKNQLKCLVINVYLALAFLVLQRTIEQDDARVFDHPSHPGVSHVFVDHHALQHTGVLDDPTWNLNAPQELEQDVALKQLKTNCSYSENAPLVICYKVFKLRC